MNGQKPAKRIRFSTPSIIFPAPSRLFVAIVLLGVVLGLVAVQTAQAGDASNQPTSPTQPAAGPTPAPAPAVAAKPAAGPSNVVAISTGPATLAPAAEPTTPSLRRLAGSEMPRITLMTADNTPIDKVLAKIRSDTGINVEARGAARGQNISALLLKDIPIKDALDQIAAQKGWIAYQKGGNWYVSDQKTYESEVVRGQVVQRIIHTQYITAEEARQIVERMITANVGHIQSDLRTNQLIVTDLLPVVEAIERTLRLLDQRVFMRVFTLRHADPQTVMTVLQDYKSAPGRLILNPKMRQIIAEDIYENIQRMEVMVDILDRGPEMRIYDLNNVDFDGQSLQDIEAALTGQITEGAYMKFNPQNGVMILIDLPSVHEKVVKILKAIDQPARQVYIQADIVETRFSHSFSFGIDWEIADDRMISAPSASTGGTGTTGIGTGTGTGSSVGGIGLQPAQDTATQLGFTDVATAVAAIRERYPVITGGSKGFTLDYLSRHARMTFNAVMSDNETRILAQPRVLVKNREPADIQDGGTIPYVTTTYYGGGGGYGGSPSGYQGSYGGYVPSVGMGSVPTGVTLTVDPSVMSNGLIELRVTLTNISGDLRKVTSYDRVVEVPQTSNQTINTVLVIPDGQTRMIGGMVENREGESVSGIPFLKDIPVIGPVLFGNKSIGPVTRRTLLMFITPSVIQEKARRYAVPPDDDEKTPPVFHEESVWSRAAVDRAVREAKGEAEVKFPGFRFPEAEAPTTGPRRAGIPTVRLEHAPTSRSILAEEPTVPGLAVGERPTAPPGPPGPGVSIPPQPEEQPIPPEARRPGPPPPVEERPTTPTVAPPEPTLPPPRVTPAGLPPGMPVPRETPRPPPEGAAGTTFPTAGTVLLSPGPPPVLLSGRRPADLFAPGPPPIVAGVSPAREIEKPTDDDSVVSSYELMVVGEGGRSVTARPSGEEIDMPALGTVAIPSETLAAIATPSPVIGRPAPPPIGARTPTPPPTVVRPGMTPKPATPYSGAMPPSMAARPTPAGYRPGSYTRPTYPDTPYGYPPSIRPPGIPSPPMPR